MFARRTPWKRFGASLAGVALTLQLTFAAWGLALAGSGGDPAQQFAEHALCLAGGAPAAPDRQAPAAPAHDHGAYCCLWHSLPALQSEGAAAPLPVVYAAVDRVLRGEPTVLPGPHRRPANARAPPALT